MAAMISQRTISYRSTGRVLASFLLVWMSGVACLLHCATVCAHAATEEARSCSAMAETASDSCCCEEEAAETIEVEPGRDAARGVTEASSCCLLRAREAAPAPVPASVDAPAIEAAAPAIQVLAASTPVYSGDRAQPIRNRGDTYLRCCVFLI